MTDSILPPISADPALPAEAPPISMTVRVMNLIAVFVPFAALIVAIIFAWGWGITGVELGLMIGMYLATVLGITVGFHRYFTHKSFETNKVVQAVLAILGSMAIQGPLLKWVAQHRQHHRFSDTQADPHSPHYGGEGVLGMLRGFWHAHIGWFFEGDSPELHRYVKDLHRSKLLRTISALFPLWVVLGIAIPGVLGGLISQSWTGVLLGLIWGGGVRIFLVHHVTWSINSVCHIWGARPFPTHDESRNNVIFGILGLGEGWHNNHHVYPSSARHGLKWWQIDLSYEVIRLLALLGLARNLRLATIRH